MFLFNMELRILPCFLFFFSPSQPIVPQSTQHPSQNTLESIFLYLHTYILSPNLFILTFKIYITCIHFSMVNTLAQSATASPLDYPRSLVKEHPVSSFLLFLGQLQRWMDADKIISPGCIQLSNCFLL
ncbi:hypothetical protein H1C71_008519 [Ictidomys tridecemlineatus]|nr:hypothetical protein H1C71_008519 [Ictidomys tridecemlineatus]KAG3284954.1 hypothetical protein H1C71_008519 [Ictidomys tridecemlineatus]